MRESVVIINKIRVLGSLTYKALQIRGYSNIECFTSIEKAEKCIMEKEEGCVVILELTPSWNKQREIEFVDNIKAYQLIKPIHVICTSEEVEQNMFREFLKHGCSSIVFQRFDLLNFGLELDEAIQQNFAHANIRV